MKRVVGLLLFAVGLGCPTADAGDESTIEIYVEPLYNSDGPKVSVGKFSGRLAAADKDSVLQVVVDAHSPHAKRAQGTHAHRGLAHVRAASR